jgi:hypothetical protein
MLDSASILATMIVACSTTFVSPRSTMTTITLEAIPTAVKLLVSVSAVKAA